MIHETISPIWGGYDAIVAAPGPSLTVDVAEACRGARDTGRYRVLCVGDAYTLMPWADALFACDARWWDHHKGTTFAGPKWSSHERHHNEKMDAAARHGLQLVNGRQSEGFSFDVRRIHYGHNSGFQGVNLALLFGCRRIVLVGFNMQCVNGMAHFFGDHPSQIRGSQNYNRFVEPFKVAAKMLPADVEIVNATPDSALKCFPFRPLHEALALEQIAA